MFHVNCASVVVLTALAGIALAIEFPPLTPSASVLIHAFDGETPDDDYDILEEAYDADADIAVAKLYSPGDEDEYLRIAYDGNQGKSTLEMVIDGDYQCMEDEEEPGLAMINYDGAFPYDIVVSVYHEYKAKCTFFFAGDACSEYYVEGTDPDDDSKFKGVYIYSHDAQMVDNSATWLWDDDEDDWVTDGLLAVVEFTTDVSGVDFALAEGCDSPFDDGDDDDDGGSEA